MNFFFEYIDIIKPTGEGIEFTPTDGLSPRKRLEDMANEVIDSSEGREKEIWQRARDYAVEYFVKEEEK